MAVVRSGFFFFLKWLNDLRYYLRLNSIKRLNSLSWIFFFVDSLVLSKTTKQKHVADLTESIISALYFRFNLFNVFFYRKEIKYLQS